MMIMMMIMIMMMLQATSDTGDRAGEAQGPPDTVQSLQHEIEVIKAKIAQEREKIRDKTLQQVADIASVPSIDQLNIKIRKSLKGHNAKVVCLDWCSDKRHLVSSAQDGKLIVWVGSRHCTADDVLTSHDNLRTRSRPTRSTR